MRERAEETGSRFTRSGVRWRILALLFLISVVTYVDRVNIAVAGKAMMSEFGISLVQMGTVLSAFTLGYALLQVPGGWLGDRWGSRTVLAIALLWWSALTVFTANGGDFFARFGVNALASLIAVRFLVGAGEAAALPNFNRTVANWLAPSERGLGMGVSIGGIGLGSALTPPLVAWLMTRYGWRASFYVTGAVGIGVAALWYLLARDDPRHHSGVNPEELAWITRPAADARPSAPPTPTGLGGLLRLRSVWFLTLSYSMVGYVAYIYLSWFFLYLVNIRHFSVLQGSFLASTPFIAIAVFCPMGGWLTDAISKKYGPGLGRKGVGIGGMCLTSVLIFSGAATSDPYRAVLVLSLGAGILYATVAAYWATTIDLSQKHSGALSGLMNTGANLGGTLSPTLTPLIGERWGWPIALSVAAASALFGALLWLGVRSGNPPR